MNISGNTIFIPGGTSGIGLALALALQAKGNTVIVGGRRAPSPNPRVDTVPIDTPAPAGSAAPEKTVPSRPPQLNVLIAMAGIMRVEDWRRPESFLASAEEVVT